MKARIIKTENSRVTTQGLRKLVSDESYAREFYNFLLEKDPDANYGNSFEEWYKKIKLAEFANRWDNIYARTELVSKYKKKGGV